MAISSALFSSDKEYWETPQKLFDALNEEFHFTIDVAASDENAKLPRYFTKETDGLKQDWGGRLRFAILLMGETFRHGSKNVKKKPRNQTQSLFC